MDTDLLVIGIGVDCAELLCDLDKFPLEEGGALEGEAEDPGHRCRIEFEEEVPHVRGPDGGGEPEEHPVRVEFQSDRRPVPGGDQDSEDPPQRLVRLVPGADIADDTIISIFKRDQLVGGDERPVLVHLGEELLRKTDVLLSAGIVPDVPVPPHLPDFERDIVQVPGSAPLPTKGVPRAPSLRVRP